MEIIRVDKARLEEVCVLVNVDEFHHVPREGKNRPYKVICPTDSVYLIHHQILVPLSPLIFSLNILI
jgi:hypothetical protein